MQIEFKDLLTWGGTGVMFLAQWFHLKGRVTVIEALRNSDKETFKDALDRIDQKLTRIDQKLDNKADK